MTKTSYRNDIYFTVIPHHIREDYKNGKLTAPEFCLLLHIRTMADLYGQYRVSADQLREDVYYGKVKKNTVNDRLLSLRNKDYITYPNRKGNGGAVTLLVNDWLSRGGVWTRCTVEEDRLINGSERITKKEIVPDENLELNLEKRKPKIEKKPVKQASNRPCELSKDGRDYTNKQKNTNKDTNSSTLPKAESIRKIRELLKSSIEQAENSGN